jgi:hypothetical protein
MRGLFLICLLGLLTGAAASADEIQGVITDWRCTENMVRNGREKTLQQDRSCSLARNPDRAEYGLITDDNKFYRLDAEGNKKVRTLLHNSPNKDNLRVILTGDVQGNLIKVTYASLL